MTTSKHTFSALATATVLGTLALISACDEGVDAMSPEHAALIADYEAQLDAELDAPARVLVAEDEPTLQAPAGAEQNTEWTSVYDYVTVTKVNHLDDGDVITIHSDRRGFMSCLGSEIVYTHTLLDSDEYLWQVHDNGDRLQFERIDGGGRTGMYLKMKGSGSNFEVYCGEITGSGAQASWTTTATSYSTPGTWYRPIQGQITHTHNGNLCLNVPESGSGANGSTCTNDIERLFQFNIWDNIAPDCVDDVCSCETDLDCAFAGSPNYVCINGDYCGLQVVL